MMNHHHRIKYAFENRRRQHSTAMSAKTTEQNQNVMQTSLLICVICCDPYFINQIVNEIDQTEDTAQVFTW